MVRVSEAAELVGRSVRWTYAWINADRAARAVDTRDGLRVRLEVLLADDAARRRLSR